MDSYHAIAVEDFQARVWDYYAQNKRTMPWRENTDPYWILVSEVMLQQTQVGRVEPKFREFIAAFPSFDALSRASLAEVLAHWNGLGYNRRAKFLHEAAILVCNKFGGLLPRTINELDALPGIGRSTAAAITTYAYNQSVAYVETNIRTVLLHHFFTSGEVVSDEQLLQLAERVLDHDDPRQWHWALMDYGTYLKSTHGGHLSQSKHYRKQASFIGSKRQMRGRIVRALVTGGALDDEQLRRAVDADDRYDAALAGLAAEGIVTNCKDKLYLTGDATSRIIRASK